jgi:hypothetical protein
MLRDCAARLGGGSAIEARLRTSVRMSSSTPMVIVATTFSIASLSTSMVVS